MAKFRFPDPVLDRREVELLGKLKDDYNRFITPGKISKAADSLHKSALRIAPEKLKKMAAGAIEVAAEWEIIKKTLNHAGRGFGVLQKQTSRFTLNKTSVIVKLKELNPTITKFDQICALRSYHIEAVVSKGKYKDYIAAFSEGFATGWPGVPGIPFNIALSFLLYFRAAQSIGLYYGYDLKDDPRELEFAASVAIESLAPSADAGANTLSGMIGKMMLAPHLNALTTSLRRGTYTAMAKKGGAELFYVQIRALANKAAKKALENAGRKGLEAGIFRNMLEQIGKRIPKKSGAKGIPLLGAMIGGLSDTYYMHCILEGSNLIYHKRFLFEKEHRLNILRGD